MFDDKEDAYIYLNNIQGNFINMGKQDTQVIDMENHDCQIGGARITNLH